MTVSELRAICHGAGINTAGMERQQLERATGEVLARGTFFSTLPNAPQPIPMPQQQQSHQRRRLICSASRISGPFVMVRGSIRLGWNGNNWNAQPWKFRLEERSFFHQELPARVVPVLHNRQCHRPRGGRPPCLLPIISVPIQTLPRSVCRSVNC